MSNQLHYSYNCVFPEFITDFRSSDISYDGLFRPQTFDNMMHLISNMCISKWFITNSGHGAHIGGAVLCSDSSVYRMLPLSVTNSTYPTCDSAHYSESENVLLAICSRRGLLTSVKSVKIVPSLQVAVCCACMWAFKTVGEGLAQRD